MYRRYLRTDQAAAQAYLSQAMDYKAQSLDARYQAQNYLKLYRQIRSQLAPHSHGDDHDRDRDGREQDDDDREREDDDD
jgi:hypothetical protein